MIYPLNMIDSLSWHIPNQWEEQKADKTGWKPRNKQWKAARLALWEKINAGPHPGFREGHAPSVKSRDSRFIEEFFLTGKSNHRVGRDSNPINLKLYFLFYPDLTREVLDRIVKSIPANVLDEHVEYWLFPAWMRAFMNFPEYFVERILLLQDYFWPVVSSEGKLSRDMPYAMSLRSVSLFTGYSLRYLHCQEWASCESAFRPRGWRHAQSLKHVFHFFSHHAGEVNDSISEKGERSWYKLFLLIRNHVPWNDALPGEGLEAQREFVSAFCSLVEQQGLPARLQPLWDRAGKDDEILDVTLEQLQARAVRTVSAAVCEQLGPSVMKDIVDVYRRHRFTDAMFDDAVSTVDLSGFLASESLAEYGCREGHPFPVREFTFPLNENYGHCRQVATLLMPVLREELALELLPRLFLVLRPLNASGNSISRRDKFRDIYLCRVIQQELAVRLAFHDDFSRIYVVRMLGRDPEDKRLTDEERQEMQQSGWYRGRQYQMPFIDRPYFSFRQVPFADEEFPACDEIAVHV